MKKILRSRIQRKGDENMLREFNEEYDPIEQPKKKKNRIALKVTESTKAENVDDTNQTPDNEKKEND